MPGRVEGKVTCITGAASGIGRSAAMLLAREGAVIVATDVQAQKGAALVSDIEHAGGRAVANASGYEDTFVRRLTKGQSDFVGGRIAA